MLEKLQKDNFKCHLNEHFTVHSEELGPVEVELVEVSGRVTGNIETFSLLFRNAGDKVFRQATHRVTHPSIGEFPLFIGPVMTAKNDGVYYEALFSYII